MRRSYVLAVLAWSVALGGVVAACGDSVTGNLDDGVDASARDATADTSTGTTPPPTNPPPNPGPVDAAPDVANIDGGPAGVSVDELDFGEVDCGSTGQAKSFTIGNPSNEAVTWAASLAKGNDSPYTLSTSSGTLAPGESIVVTVTPKAVPSSFSTSNNALGDTLTVNLGTSSPTIALKQTAHGARLFFSPATVPFGNASIAIPETRAPFSVANSGNAPAEVTLTMQGEPELGIVETPLTFTANPGLTSRTAKFSPTVLKAYAGEAVMTVAPGTPLCAPLPTNLVMTGTGTSSTIGVSPAEIQFGNSGLVDCGATATPQKVRITNTSNATTQFTATLGRGTTVFTVAPASGPISANSFIDVTVTPKPIPTSTPVTEDLFSDSLTIATDAPGDSGRSPVVLHQTARGAILVRSTGSLNFGNVPFGTTGTLTYTYTNTGNVDITLNLLNAAPEYIQQPASITIAGGGTLVPQVQFKPVGTVQTTFTDTSTYTVATATPTCGGLPGAPTGSMSFTGVGVPAGVSVAPSPLNMGFVPCGTTGTSKTVRFTNNGPEATYNLELERGAASWFTITSPVTGTIPERGFIDVEITPKPTPQFSSTATNFYNDRLLLTLSTNPSNPTPVTINLTALGAIIRSNRTTPHNFGNTSISGPGATPLAVQIRNDGNVSASVTLSTTPQPGPYGTTVSAMSLAPATNQTTNLTFMPTIAGAAPAGKFIVQSTDALCEALPADVTLTGNGTSP